MSTETLPKVVTIEGLKAAPWRVMFLDCATHWSQTRTSPAFPGVTIADIGPRGRGTRVQRRRRFYVHGNEVDSLEAIVEALNKREEAP